MKPIEVRSLLKIELNCNRDLEKVGRKEKLQAAEKFVG